MRVDELWACGLLYQSPAETTHMFYSAQLLQNMPTVCLMQTCRLHKTSKIVVPSAVIIICHMNQQHGLTRLTVRMFVTRIIYTSNRASTKEQNKNTCKLLSDLTALKKTRLPWMTNNSIVDNNCYKNLTANRYLLNWFLSFFFIKIMKVCSLRTL